MEPSPASPIRFTVYSDYLCPWCQNASLRLRRVEQEYAGLVELEWRSYLLRPNPSARSPEKLEKFRAYSRSWLRPAAEEDSGEFRVWESDEGPPTHSVPPHLVAKAAARLGKDVFYRVHDRLLRAYFAENRDISDPEVLRALWEELGLPEAAFEVWSDPALLEETLDEFNRAREAGVTGVPAVQLQGNDAVIVGAHPADLYRRWIDRLLERGTPV
jgi:predicted DsbA family dithiol-disulfide isomerase